MNKEPLEKTPEEKPETHGGKNLIVLGIGAILISTATSLTALYIYHSSGDIYLDCSMPDSDCPSAHSDSEENKVEQNYKFSDSGEVTPEILEEYLKEFNSSSEKLRKLNNPFSSEPLSDESLGI